jgi:hypothetical protein
MRTTSLAEMGPGSLIALHVATCARCASVAEELRYAEYQLMRALNEQKPGDDPAQIALAAMDGSERLRRKGIGRWTRGVLVIMACALFAIFMNQRTNRNPGGTDYARSENAIVTRTISLKCLKPDQAMAIATPYLRDKAAIYPVPDSRLVTLRGKFREIQTAISEIDRLDVACELPAPTPEVVTSPSR